MNLFNKKQPDVPKKMRHFLVNYTAHFKTVSINVMQNVKQESFINQFNFERDMAQLWATGKLNGMKSMMAGCVINSIQEVSEEDYIEFLKVPQIIEAPKPQIIVSR